MRDHPAAAIDAGHGAIPHERRAFLRAVRGQTTSPALREASACRTTSTTTSTHCEPDPAASGVARPHQGAPHASCHPGSSVGRTARVATLAVTTLLMALLSVGALVAGAQSPSPAPPEVQPLSFFSGFQAESAGGACQVAEPTVEVVGYVTQERGESWGCQTVTTAIPGSPVRPSSSANSRRGLRCDLGPERRRRAPWRGPGGSAPCANGSRTRPGMGGHLDGASMGSEFDQGAGWFVGEGAYEGLAGLRHERRRQPQGSGARDGPTTASRRSGIADQ